MGEENRLPFFIASEARSGFHFLASLINSTRAVGYVREFLHPKDWHDFRNRNEIPEDSSILSYFEQIYETSTNPCPAGHWGMKADHYQFRIVKRWLKLMSIPPASIQWIWLRRKDKVAQAKSLIKAKKSGIWAIGINDKNRIEKQNLRVEVSQKELDFFTDRFLEREQRWDAFFRKNSITPHMIFYEGFIDPATWQKTIADIFDFLKVPYQFPLTISTNLFKQANGSEEKEPLHETCV